MTRQDDPSLSGDVRLWRRIPPDADRVKLDQITQQPRPSSMNFRDKNHELSVYVASETTIDEILAGHQGFGIVELTAAEVRAHVPAVILCRDPDPHPAHALVCAKLTRSQSERLARVCRWVVTPQTA